MHRLRCFGRLAIEDEGGERVQLRSRKHLALLVYLAAHRDRRHERGRVARLFWDTEPDLARHSLSQALYDLCKHVPGLELDRTNREVGLGPNGLVYEGEAFEEAVREDRLGEAVRLYDGSFAPDLETVGGPDFERWVERERTRFRSLAEKALLRRVSGCADAGQWGEMVVAGNRLVDMNPLSEEAHRAVMRGLWLQGDRAAALAHFEEHEDFLERERPGGIDEETRELVQKIRTVDRSSGGGSVHERPRPEMVGREEEFRVLRDALSDVLDGESRFIVIRGEAGIGKTRLLEEFTEVAALEDVRLLESRCYAAESDVPYGPIVDGLKELAREFAESPEAEDQQFYQLGHLFPEAFGEPETGDWFSSAAIAAQRRLADELQTVLSHKAQEQPIIWMIEDLHWADSTSCWVLKFIAKRLVDTPVLIAVTTRRMKFDGTDDRYSLTHSSTISLEPLTDDNIEGLITPVGVVDDRDVSGIVSLSGGNPFYALELAKSQSDNLTSSGYDQSYKNELPDQISTALTARFATTTPEEQRILGIVAVADAYASPNLIISLTDLSLKELLKVASTLHDRSILRMTEDRLLYRHDIVRRFFYHSLDSLSRTALHLEIANWLANKDDEIDEGTLAKHYYNASDYEEAFRFSFRAAKKAICRFANQEAINLSRQALECARTDTEMNEARSVLGEAYYRYGDVSQALSTLKGINDGWSWETVIGDRSIHLLKADSAVELNSWNDLDEALCGLKSSSCVTKRDYLWAKHLTMKSAIRKNDSDLSAITLDEVNNVDISTNELESESLVRMTRAAYQVFYGNIDKSRDYLRFVENTADDLPPALQYTVRQLAVLVGQRLGELEVACRQAEVTYQLASQRHDTVPALTSLNNKAALCLELGAWEDVRQTLDTTEDIMQASERHPSNIALMVATNRADYLFVTEQYPLLEQHCEKALLTYSSERAGYIHPELLSVYGLCVSSQGKLEKAKTICERIEVEYSDGSQMRSGVQNGYKYYWLRTTLGWLQGNRECVGELRERARIEETSDKLSAARMHWLAWLLSHSEKDGVSHITNGVKLTEIPEFVNMGQLNISWFGYFSRRWLRRVRMSS